MMVDEKEVNITKNNNDDDYLLLIKDKVSESLKENNFGEIECSKENYYFEIKLSSGYTICIFKDSILENEKLKVKKQFDKANESLDKAVEALDRFNKHID